MQAVTASFGHSSGSASPAARIVRTLIGFRHSIAGQSVKQAASCSVRSVILVFSDREFHSHSSRECITLGRFSLLTFLSLVILPRSDGDFHTGLARASATMLAAFHDMLLISGLALAGALTAAWDGLLGYGLFKLMGTVF
jgi:hypothetical protein